MPPQLRLHRIHDPAGAVPLRLREVALLVLAVERDRHDRQLVGQNVIDHPEAAALAPPTASEAQLSGTRLGHEKYAAKPTRLRRRGLDRQPQYIRK